MTEPYAEIWAGTKRVAVVRARTHDTFMADFFTHIAREAQRKRYRDERLHPEWVDVGGEA